MMIGKPEPPDGEMRLAALILILFLIAVAICGVAGYIILTG